MKPSVLAFAFPLALFAAWMGYLGWLVANRPLQAPGYPLVLSQPQILTSPIDIIGEIEDAEEGMPASVKVVEVLFGEGPQIGDTIQVDGVFDCRPVKRGEHEVPKDWNGAGLYLVPLGPLDKKTGRYEVAPVPLSPGFREPGLRRIYRDSHEIRAQYAKIAKP